MKRATSITMGTPENRRQNVILYLKYANYGCTESTAEIMFTDYDNVIKDLSLSLSLSLYIYIYIYIYSRFSKAPLLAGAIQVHWTAKLHYNIIYTRYLELS